MARPLRIERVGGWYHITGRGNERRAVFRDDRDRAHFLELLAAMTERFAVNVCCFALMDNHYHLLLRLRDKHLSRSLQWLNLSYTLWFNRRHDRSGHLFQGRFKSILFDPASAALELSRYVHLNPVRVASLGLSKPRRAAARTGAGEAPKARDVRARLALLRSYPWSSYRAYIGATRGPGWLDSQAILAKNRGTLAQRREAYRQYVEAAAAEGAGSVGVWSELKEGCLLGSQRFLTQVRQHISGGAEQKPPPGCEASSQPGARLSPPSKASLENAGKHSAPGAPTPRATWPSTWRAALAASNCGRSPTTRAWGSTAPSPWPCGATKAN